MFEPKFSRGDWERGTDDDDACTVYANGLLVARAYGPLDLPCFEPETEAAYDAAIEETEANADLIAAAKAMYEALEYAGDRQSMKPIAFTEKWFTRYPEVIAGGSCLWVQAQLLEEFLRNRALAKARGETP